MLCSESTKLQTFDLWERLGENSCKNLRRVGLNLHKNISTELDQLEVCEFLNSALQKRLRINFKVAYVEQ